VILQALRKRKVVRVLVATVTAAVIVMLALVSTVFTAARQAPDEPHDDVLSFIALNPEQVGIACYLVDDPEAGFYHHENDDFKLASTYKILIAIGYAEQVAAGLLDPDARIAVRDIDRYYLPGTDGNAHPTWLAHAPVDDDDSVRLHDVAYGMIRFSSNADTDYLLSRLDDTGYDWADLFARLGTTTLDEPQPTLGLFLMLNNPDTGLADPESMNYQEHHRHADELTRRYANDAQWRDRAQNMQTNLRTLAVQPKYFARFGPSASPADTARMMRAIYVGSPAPGEPAAVSEDARAVVQNLLEWPLRESPSLEAHFNTLGVKGGSLPGILTAAYYGQSAGGQPMVLTVFYRNLDFEHYLAWSRSGAMQFLELEAFKTHCGVFDAVLTAAH
jgi:D-alanyl-D-alanine carboxypeptidase